MQDVELCKERYPTAISKPIGLQFVDENTIALLEFTLREDGDLLRFNLIDEKHYQIVPRSEINDNELIHLMERESRSNQ